MVRLTSMRWGGGEGLPKQEEPEEEEEEQEEEGGRGLPGLKERVPVAQPRGEEKEVEGMGEMEVVVEAFPKWRTSANLVAGRRNEEQRSKMKTRMNMILPT